MPPASDRLSNLAAILTPIAQDLFSILNHISEVDFRSETPSSGFQEGSVFLVLSSFLNLYGALYLHPPRFQLSKKHYLLCIHHPTMILLNEVCHYFFVNVKSANGPNLILTHEAAIPFTSALRMAVSFRLTSCVVMESPKGCGEVVKPYIC